jgi:hypothetical protein
MKQAARRSVDNDTMNGKGAAALARNGPVLKTLPAIAPRRRCLRVTGNPAGCLVTAKHLLVAATVTRGARLTHRHLDVSQCGLIGFPISGIPR